ncbi:hypothetical protein KIN20_036983 [Parelaphostrongylus tenuis]|uniref:Uncharacterized protein n=1 Tax=Parelaphostrongylus tenuis TaxID=148309 RepID=A0AAD5WKZ1_PARTN|nr:hypothetical protein KIN20_036983 [Parelaphostrongylus tenuis]
MTRCTGLIATSAAVRRAYHANRTPTGIPAPEQRTQPAKPSRDGSPTAQPTKRPTDRPNRPTHWRPIDTSHDDTKTCITTTFRTHQPYCTPHHTTLAPEDGKLPVEAQNFALKLPTITGNLLDTLSPHIAKTKDRDTCLGVGPHIGAFARFPRDHESKRIPRATRTPPGYSCTR